MSIDTKLNSQGHMLLADKHAAHNYHPLPVVAASALGAHVTDVEGKRYLDCLAAYSAVNFGHSNPRLIARAKAQLDNVTLTSRAFHNDQFGPFAEALTALAKKDMMLPMNTGAEAVETAIKVARKWGYKTKGVRKNKAEIIVAGENFHGRTTTIISFSTDQQSRADFGPFTPGFKVVPYGDIKAMRKAVTKNTVAIMVEPIQGEAGIIVPPMDYLKGIRALCDEKNVLFIADEIQAGLGRTGYTFTCDYFGVVPDMYVLGKALGGGIVPVSAVLANESILGLIKPGEHGSTFGGNPMAAAVGHEVVTMLSEGFYQARAAKLGAQLLAGLAGLEGKGVTAVRGLGLWAGIDIDPKLATGRAVCEKLMARGILAKDTHSQTIRFAPPIVIEPEEIDWLVAELAAVLSEFRA